MRNSPGRYIYTDFAWLAWLAASTTPYLRVYIFSVHIDELLPNSQITILKQTTCGLKCFCCQYDPLEQLGLRGTGAEVLWERRLTIGAVTARASNAAVLEQRWLG